MSIPVPRLALTVEQDGTRRFHWAILKALDTTYEYKKLVESGSSFVSYRKAFDAGHAALWKFAPELDDKN